MSDFHQTVHVQYLGAGNLQWNEYEIEFWGTPVASYDVYEDIQGNDSWQLLTSVPGTQTTATDPNYTQHPFARYRVEANWFGGCTSSRSTYGSVVSNIITQQGTGIMNNGSTYSVFPNPTSNLLHLNLNGLKTDVVITSIVGESVFEITTSKVYEVIDMSSFASGVYLITVSSDDFHETKRIIKE